jgi:O-antigen ligase/tetratricopeptide (TPR) repeat protein
MLKKEYTSRIIILSVVMMIFIAPMQIGDISFYGIPRYLKTGLGALIILIAVFTWLYQGYQKHELSIAHSKLYFPMALFLLWSLISFFWSFNLHLATIAWIQYLTYVLLFFIVLNSFTSKASINALLYTLISSLFVVSIIGLVQQYFSEIDFVRDFYFQFASPSATFANKNLASHFVVMTIPLSFLMFVVTKSKRLSFVYSLVTFFALWYVIMITARQAYVAVFVELLVLVLFLFFDYVKNNNTFLKSIQHIKIKIITFVFLIFSLFIVGNFSSDGFNLSKGNKLEKVAKISLEGGSARIPAWKNTIEMIKDHPIAGVGIGQWQEYYPLYYDASAPDVIFGDKTRLTKAHNEYLEMFANVGLIGFLPLLWVFISVFKSTWNNLKGNDDRGRVLAISLGMVGFTVVAFFSFPIWAYVSAFILFIFIALLVNMTSTVEKKHIVPINKKYYLIFSSVVLLIFSLVFFYSYQWIKSEHYRVVAINKSNANDFDLAILYSVKSSDLNPYNQQNLNQLGSYLLKNGKEEESVPYLIKSNDITLFNSISLVNLMIAYNTLGEVEKSKEISREILNNDPRNVKALANLVRILYNQGEYEETTKLYRRLKLSFEYFKDRSNFGPYHQIMSSLALKLNNPKYFSYIYDDLVKRRPTANNYAVYGFVEYKLGNKAKAKKLFLEAIEIDGKISILDEVRIDLKL